jgi:hypothetical protein
MTFRLEGKIELKEEVKWGSEVLKFNNSRLLSMERLLEAIYKSKVADVDGVKNLEGEVLLLGAILVG